MTTIYVIDVDGTVANCEERARVLVHECIQCLGNLSGIISSRAFICPYCGCMDSHTTSESWAMFISDHLVMEDSLILGAEKGVKALESLGHPVHYLTARPPSSHDVTSQWLQQAVGFDPGKQLLQTRETEDDRTNSAVFKERIVEKWKLQFESEHGDFNLIFIDDNHDNLKMFARHGLAFEAPHFWDALHT